MIRESMTALAFMAAVSVQAAAPELRVYSGVRDTLTAEKTTIVCVATPGSEATVNGQPVHVYKTGSFGAEVALNPGENVISVSVTADGRTVSRDLMIFRAQAPAGKAAVSGAPDDEIRMFASPRFVITLPGAYLQYGNGNDRLGGSKMGFVSDGIRLRAIGECGSLYCVRLAAGRLAYVPKEYVEPADYANPVVNTGSWSVVNTGNTDRVSVALPCRLAYQYTTDLEPSTISIDLFGATDNSNWITQRSAQLGIIDYVDFRQISDDVYRVILRLKDKYQWGFSVRYEGNNLVVDVRHAPSSLKLRDLTIGLDAGHGGEYPGAISPSGLKEKDVNLDIVLHMRDLLQKKGAKVVLTREGDTGPSMTERKQILREAGVDLSVSVHNNSGGSALSSPGTSVLYKHLFDRPFSECVLNRMLETGLPLFGLVGNFNFSLNGPTEYPNCLVEGMFMSSLAEEEKLADPGFRKLVAEKIVAAIEDYLRRAASK